MSGNAATTYTKASNEAYMDKNWSRDTWESQAQIQAFKEALNSSQFQKEGVFDADTFIYTFNTLFDTYYSVLKNSGFQDSDVKSKSAYKSSDNTVNDYQKAFQNWFSKGFNWSHSSSPRTQDIMPAEGQKFKGDNLFGEITYNRVGNFLTEDTVKKLNEWLKDKGIELAEDTSHDLDEQFTTKRDANRKYYKFQKINNPDDNPNEDPGNPPNLPPINDRPETSSSTRFEQESGVDLTPLHTLKGLLDAYSQTTAAMRNRMSAKLPYEKGMRFYTSTKDGFNQLQAAKQHAAEVRNQIQNQAKTTDLSKYIGAALDAELSIQDKIINPAIAQSEQIFNESVKNQEKKDEYYDVINNQVANKNAQIRYQNDLIDANARHSKNYADYMSRKAADQELVANSAAVKKAYTDKHNARIQQLAGYDYEDGVATAYETYKTEFKQAGDDESKQKLALEKFEQAKIKAKRNYDSAVSAGSIIFGNPFYYSSVKSNSTGSVQRSTPTRTVTRTTTTSISPVTSSKKGGMLLPKFQQGGDGFAIYTPTILPYGETPTVQPTTTTASKSKEKDDDDGFDLIDKSLVKDLEEKVLPSDYQYILQQIASMEQATPFTSQTFSRSKMYSLASKINSAIYNKKMFDESIANAKSNDALNEIAINEHGEIWTLDQNGVCKTMSRKEFEKKRKKVMALTNSQLANYRATTAVPSMAFNSSVFSSIQTSIGTKKISDQVFDLVTKMGDVELTEVDYTNLYREFGNSIVKNTPTQLQLKALQDLKSLYEDALVEKEISTTNGFTQAFQDKMEIAASYIWKVLPQQSKDTLLANATVRQGIDTSEPAKVIIPLIQEAIFMNKKQVAKEKQTIKSSAAKTAERQYSMTASQAFVDGNINRATVTMRDPSENGQYTFTFQGSRFPTLTDTNKNTIPTGGVMGDTFLNSGLLPGMFDTNQLYIGNKKVDYETMQNVVHNPNVDIMRVSLPVNHNGDIDFKAMEGLNLINQELSEVAFEDTLTKAATYNSYFTERNLPFQMDAQGNIIFKNGKMEDYAMTYGYLEDDDISEVAYVKELTGKEEDSVTDYVHSIYDKYNRERPTWAMFNDMYTFPIFIKIDKNANVNVPLYENRGPQVPKQGLEEVMTRQAAGEEPARRIDGSVGQMYDTEI